MTTLSYKIKIINNITNAKKNMTNIECKNIKEGLNQILLENKELKDGDYTIYLINNKQKYKYNTIKDRNKNKNKNTYNIEIMKGGGNSENIYKKQIKAYNPDSAVKYLINTNPEFKKSEYNISVSQENLIDFDTLLQK